MFLCDSFDLFILFHHSNAISISSPAMYSIFIRGIERKEREERYHEMREFDFDLLEGRAEATRGGKSGWRRSRPGELKRPRGCRGIFVKYATSLRVLAKTPSILPPKRFVSSPLSPTEYIKIKINPPTSNLIFEFHFYPERI